MNSLFRLFKIESVFSNFNKDVALLGWVKANQLLFKRLGISYELDLKNLPAKGPIIIYSNHPTGLDPFLLSGVTKREDSYFLGDNYHLKKGKDIAKHIIPILSDNFWRIVFRPLSNWPGYILMRFKVPAVNQQKAKEFNRKSMEKVTVLLKDNKQIIIFPSGGEYEFLRWKKGLMKIILECHKQNINFSLYKIKIDNLSEIGLFFHFVFGKKLYKNKKVQIIGNLINLKQDFYKKSFQDMSRELKIIV